MQQSVRKVEVAIIGGGWSGVYALKHCIERNLNTILLESEKEIGGQWVFNENKVGGVLKNTIAVSSKLYMSPSDFPLPEHISEFPTAKEIHQHFLDYVDHFKLDPYIELENAVISVKKIGGYWNIHTATQTIVAKKIVVATGTNSIPRYPDKNLFDKFNGTTSHSAYYKGDVSPFVGKRVLFVGGSDTACDIAHALRDVAEVTVSLRKGSWFQSRDLGEFHKELIGRPADMYYSAFLNKLLETFGDKFLGKLAKDRIEKRWGQSGSDIPAWRSEAGYLNTYYTKSRHLIYDIRAGKTQARGKITNIDGQNVWFDGEENPQEFDHILFCTGYQNTLKFDAPFQPGQALYRMVMDAEDPTLAFTGYVRAYVTSIVMLSEMQGRWIADVFSEKISVPNTAKRIKIAAEEKAYLKKRFPVHHEYIAILVDPYRYMKRLAKDMNQIPSKLVLFVKNPKQVRDIVFNTWSQYSFRLKDESLEKRTIAAEEIEKLSHYPTSVLLRKEASMVDVFRAFIMRSIKNKFNEGNPIRELLLKALPMIFKATMPVMSLNIRLHDLSTDLVNIVFLARLALQDGVLDSHEINYLENLLSPLNTGVELNDLIDLARVSTDTEIIESLCRESTLEKGIVAHAYALAKCDGRYDMREDTFIKKLESYLKQVPS